MRNASRICGTSIPGGCSATSGTRATGPCPHLRSTNIPGYDPTMSGVAFDPSLGRASYVVRRSGESVSVRRFNADTLAAAAKRRRAAHVRPRGAAAAGWQLRPFWRFP